LLLKVTVASCGTDVGVELEASPCPHAENKRLVVNMRNVIIRSLVFISLLEYSVL
jgi:hypothetical protein